MKNFLLIGLVVVFIAGGVALAINSKGEDEMAGMESHNSGNGQASSSSDQSAAVSTTQVEIKDYAFGPATIKVKVGDTVTWTNQDSDRHDVVDDDSSADGPKSDLLSKGESYSFTFKKAGTFNYHCSPHPYMKAKVIVE